MNSMQSCCVQHSFAAIFFFFERNLLQFCFGLNDNGESTVDHSDRVNGGGPTSAHHSRRHFCYREYSPRSLLNDWVYIWQPFRPVLHSSSSTHRRRHQVAAFPSRLLGLVRDFRAVRKQERQHEAAAVCGRHMAGRLCRGAHWKWKRRRRGAAAVEDRRREDGPRRRRRGARQGVPFGSWSEGEPPCPPPGSD